MVTDIKNLLIGILFGGKTLEGQVSNLTANAVIESLQQQEFNIIKIDIQESDFISKIHNIDLVFNCLHGEKGEDGQIQGLLELLGKPYTGSGIFTSSLCRDKVKFKKYISGRSFLTPNFIILKDSIDFKNIEEELNFPVVLKLRQTGGSVGLSKQDTFDDLSIALNEISSPNEYFIEEFILGKILTVGIVEIDSEIVCSPVVEIELPKGKDIFDFNMKLKSKAKFSLFSEESEEIKKTAISLYKETYCSDFSRIDFILKNQELYTLEINTIPALFKGSSYRYSMEMLNISFQDLCFYIIKSALSKNSGLKAPHANFIAPRF